VQARALGNTPGGTPVIITVPNQGYRVAGPVSRVAMAIPVERIGAAAATATEPTPPVRVRQRRMAVAAGLGVSLAVAFVAWWYAAPGPARSAVALAPALTGAPRLWPAGG
jgi:hypothetical protein